MGSWDISLFTAMRYFNSVKRGFLLLQGDLNQLPGGELDQDGAFGDDDCYGRWTVQDQVVCQAEGWAKKMFKMMWYDRWRLWWISLKMLITLRKAARCPKWRSQLHWEPQVPPKENLCESKYHFFLVMIFYNINYSYFFEDLHLTWNLQRRSPSTTRNATAAREANKMNKVCSSIPGVEV